MLATTGWGILGVSNLDNKLMSWEVKELLQTWLFAQLWKELEVLYLTSYPKPIKYA